MLQACQIFMLIESLLLYQAAVFVRRAESCCWRNHCSLRL